MWRICVVLGLLALSGCDSRTMGIIAAGLSGAANTPMSATQTRETFLYEREFQSGMNKVCVYRGTTGDQYVTLGSAQLCPATL